MDWLLLYAMSFVGTPGVWGGNNPMQGFDCSGFAQWILKSAGIKPPGDNSAQMLYDYFEKNGSYNTLKAGSLIFFGESALKITHVGIAVSPYQFLEAAGVKPEIKTKQDAEKAGSCVQLSQIDKRKDKVAVIYPNYVKIGML